MEPTNERRPRRRTGWLTRLPDDANRPDYAGLGGKVENILRLAEAQAAELRAAAEQEAARIIEAAEQDAARIRAEAEADARAIRAVRAAGASDATNP